MTVYKAVALEPTSRTGRQVKLIFLLFLLTGLIFYFTTASYAVEHGEHGESGDDHEKNFIVEHLTESDYLELPIPTVHGWLKIPLKSLEIKPWGEEGLDLSITKQVIWMWIAGLFLLIVFKLAFRGRKLMRNKFAHLLEVYILFVRDEIVYPNMDKENARKMMPFFLTVFFFILTCNLFGMLPSGHTATGNVNVTAGMAIIAFTVIQGMGIAQNGFIKHFRAMVPSGIPAFVIPIMIPVEIIGMLTKPFALCIRLFANMVAGHAVILAFFGLIFMTKSIFIASIVAPMSIVGIVFISILEIFIAHLQAFIFTILTVLFTSMTIHPSH